MSVIAFPGQQTTPPVDRTKATTIEPPDALQRVQALDISRSWIVEAPAGSGKTGLLIQRFLKLLAAVKEPEAVLALTFTNKATAEMRERIVEALRLAETMAELPEETFRRETALAAQAVLAQDARLDWRLRENPHRLNIRTIDSLCGEIARAVPVLAGGVGQATPLPDAGPVYREAARAVFLSLGGSDEVRNEALRTVLLLRDGNLQDCEQLLAQMLERREQWGKLVPLSSDVSEETLDAKVLPRLNRTLRSILCAALSDLQRSFPEHLLAEVAEIANLLSREPGYKEERNPLLGCSLLRNAPGATAEDLEHWKMLAHLLLKKDGGWRKRLQKNDLLIEAPRQVVTRLQQLLASLGGRDDLRQLLCSLNELPPAIYPDEQWRVAKALFRLLHDALVELKLIFAERNVCDFTELSIAARIALADPDGRNHVTHALGTRLQHLLVDEMQDTSSSQYELLEDLTRGWQAPAQTVFLVGDPKQSIYLFRQARVERFIQGMQTKQLGDLPLGLLRLTANFRSSIELVNAFNEMFEPVFRDSPDGVTYTEASGIRTDASTGQLCWHIDPIASFDSAVAKAAERNRARREEAETIAKLVCDLRERPLPINRREPWKIAVLVRSKLHALPILRKLQEAGVPHRAVEMLPLNERPEVLDALAITRALLHPADRVAWLAVLRAPWCGVTLADLHLLAAGDQKERSTEALRLHLRQRAHALPEEARARVLHTLNVMDEAVLNRGRNPLSLDVERVWHELGADLYTGIAERKNVHRFLDLLQAEEQATGILTTESVMSRLSRLFADTGAVPDAVEVLTIHKAKGLEWDLVLLPALERRGRRDNPPLLDWLEVETCDSHGHVETGVMLAPVPARGDEPGSLNRYIQKARQHQEAAELKRLLYVAATRARSSLQLFVTAAETRTGEMERRADTLAQVVWEQANAQFDKVRQASHLHLTEEQGSAPLLAYDEGDSLALAAAAEETVHRPTILKRLPFAALPRLSPQRTVDFSTMATPPRPAFLRPQGSFRARALGNAVHIFLDHLARFIQANPEHRMDRDRLLAEVNGWKQRIHTILRGLGIPQSDAAALADKVSRALYNTIYDKEGLWLLQPHTGAVSEAKLTSDQATSTYRMDRSFFAGETPCDKGSGTLWIIEYKTDERGPVPEETFLIEERQRYEAQLRTYAALRSRTLPPGTPVMLALFHPLLPSLRYWPYQA